MCLSPREAQRGLRTFVYVIVWFRGKSFGKSLREKHARVSFSKTIKIAQN